MDGFDEYIRKLRMDQKLSLRDVAARTGEKYRQAYAILTGREL